MELPDKSNHLLRKNSTLKSWLNLRKSNTSYIDQTFSTESYNKPKTIVGGRKFSGYPHAPDTVCRD